MYIIYVILRKHIFPLLHTLLDKYNFFFILVYDYNTLFSLHPQRN